MRGDRGRRHVRRAMAALLVAAGVGLTVLAAPASAAPGNSGGAAVCRQWQDLTRADGSEFANRGACVSHAARGGVVLGEDGGAPTPNEVVITTGPSEGVYNATAAEFGPQLTRKGTLGTLLPLLTSPDRLADACSPVSTSLSGAVAVIQKSTCAYTQQVLNVQQAGAVGVIIVNSEPGPPLTITGQDPSVRIPSVMVSLADGEGFIYPGGQVILAAKS
jgi:hypothetical protein